MLEKTAILTVLCIVVGWLAMVILAKAKRWRKRHRMERGVADCLRQLHSRLH